MEMNDKGRLIYADDALRMIRNSQADNPWVGTVCAGTWKTAHESALSCVDACNTVEAVEVVHAEWLDGGAVRNGEKVYDSIDCSRCEEVFKIESETREYWKERFKICPFCGAIMDGGNA